MDYRFKSAKPRDRNKSRWGRAQTLAMREAIIKRDGPNCWLCGKPFAPKEKPTLDHVVPKSMGGSHQVSNLKIAHYLCNTARGSRLDPNRAPRGVVKNRRAVSASEGQT